ncbi:MAG: hypothetical protein ACK52I_20930 [Pseudomonadota bacterium]
MKVDLLRRARDSDTEPAIRIRYTAHTQELNAPRAFADLVHMVLVEDCRLDDIVPRAWSSRHHRVRDRIPTRIDDSPNQGKRHLR